MRGRLWGNTILVDPEIGSGQARVWLSKLEPAVPHQLAAYYVCLRAGVHLWGWDELDV